MSDRDALLASILTSPEDDLPRLVYADWLDENGENERADFCRVQVELARLGPEPKCTAPKQKVCTNPACVKWIGGQGDELRRRERELLDRHAGEWAPGYSVLTHQSHLKQATFSRGFIFSVTLSWQDWLTHSPALFWHPEQRETCPHCDGTGSHRTEAWSCSQCDATGRILRSFAATAQPQPLEEVRLTTWPDGPVGESLGRFNRAVQFNASPPNGNILFTREKCPTCDGTGWGKPTRTHIYDGVTTSQSRCPGCHGQPLNSWTCDTWPGLKFVMPESTR